MRRELLRGASYRRRWLLAPAFAAMTVTLLIAGDVDAYRLLGGKWRSVTTLPYWLYTAVQKDRTAFGAAISDWNRTATPVWLIDAGTAEFASIGIRSVNLATCGRDSRWCTYGIKSPTADEVNGINSLYNPTR